MRKYIRALFFMPTAEDILRRQLAEAERMEVEQLARAEEHDVASSVCRMNAEMYADRKARIRTALDAMRPAAVSDAQDSAFALGV